MKKQILYRYLGTNGIIESPVHLEDIYYVRRLQLIADEGKRLTKDGVTLHPSVIISEDELPLWKEINVPGQE